MSVNKVILIGNLGKDPDVRYLDSGIAVAMFPLATTEKGYTTKSGVQVPERTDWHNIVMWRGMAEAAEKYLHKGDKLYLEGKIHTRSYEDNSITRYITEIFVDRVDYLTPRPTTNDRQIPTNNGVSPKPVPSQSPNSTGVTQVPTFSSQPGDTDDLPF